MRLLSGGCRCGAIRYRVADAFSLIDSPTRRPDHHIFASSKADWEQIPDDGLPRYDDYG